MANTVPSQTFLNLTIPEANGEELSDRAKEWLADRKTRRANA